MSTSYTILFFLFSFLSAVSQPFINADDIFFEKWVRMTPSGPVGLEIKPAGLVEVDFGNDGSTEVISGYTIKGDTIIFSDREGEMCPEEGAYKFLVNDYYMSFDLVDDMCNGRVKMTMGFWTRPDFHDMLDNISAKLEKTGDAELNLTRARIYLATGNMLKARSDLDEYIRHDTTDARAYINRAATLFPADMEGVITDCDKAILLEPGNKNAWFLRGLANYELGNREKACADFSQAIELGFSILKMAEEYRCGEYWKGKEKK